MGEGGALSEIRIRNLIDIAGIGEEADAVRSGALEGGSQAEQIVVVSDHEPIAARIAGWKGAVFVKGSRRYQLEKALRSSASEVHA